MTVISTVAIVGTGVIGRSWAQVFTGAGCRTHLYDSDPTQLRRAIEWINNDLEMDHEDGLITAKDLKTRLSLLVEHCSLATAVHDVGYVQECGPERMQEKKAIFAALDRLARPAVPFCSSTSGLSITEIASGLEGAARCIVAHPVNPPHVVPVVEIVPGKETDPSVISLVRDFLSSVGLMPVILRSEVRGFLLNRLQSAIFREAIHLVESGVAELKDIETVVSEGLGLRWALLGPFGVGDANTDGGLRENFARYRQTFLDLMNDLGPASSLPTVVVDQLSSAMEKLNGGVDRAKIRRWRDRMVRKIRALKAADPHP